MKIDFFKNEKLFLFLIMLFAAIFFFYSINDSVDTGDATTYLVGAKALAEGKGYTNISLPISAPIQHFPIGYPLFLSAIFFFTGFNIVFAKVFSAILMLTSIVLAYIFLKNTFNEKFALLLSSIFAFNLAVLWYAHRTFSEPLFIFFTIMAILFSQKYLEGKKTINLNLIIFSAILGIAYLVRTIGLMLVIGTIAFFSYKKKMNKAIAVLLLVAPIIIIWFFYATAHFEGAIPPADSYFNQMFFKEAVNPAKGFATPFEKIQQIISNTAHYFTEAIPKTLFPPLQTLLFFFGQNALFALIGLLFSAIFLTGFIITLQEKPLLIHFYTTLYLLLLIAFPFRDLSIANRFLLPILIFLLFFFAKGTIFLTEKFRKKVGLLKYQQKFLFVFFGIILVSSIASDLFYVSTVHQKQFDLRYTNLLNAALWINQNADEKDIILIGTPERFYLILDRKAFDIGPQEELLKRIAELNINYVIVTSYMENADEITAILKQKFEKVYEGTDATKIFSTKNKQ